MNSNNTKYLDLRFKKLKEIPDYVFKLKNLEFLNLEGNYLVSINYKISKLKKLKRLNLISNKIKKRDTLRYLF